VLKATKLRKYALNRLGKKFTAAAAAAAAAAANFFLSGIRAIGAARYWPLRL